MNTSDVAAIVITEEDFDRAVATNMAKGLHDPHFKGHADAAFVYVMGGMAFAKEVKNILFGKEVDNYE
jgi:hypothetical protein